MHYIAFRALLQNYPAVGEIGKLITAHKSRVIDTRDDLVAKSVNKAKLVITVVAIVEQNRGEPFVERTDTVIELMCQTIAVSCEKVIAIVVISCRVICMCATRRLTKSSKSCW